MKLRSGKKVSLVTPLMELELKKTVDHLKDLLKDDKPFLKELLKLSLLLGNEVYHEDVNNLVCNNYSDLKPGGHDRILMETAYKLGTLIFGTHPVIREELAKLHIRSECIKKWQIVQRELRSEIKKELSNICSELDSEESVIDMLGELDQSSNEMST